MLTSFVLNSTFVFNGSNMKYKKQAVRFILINLLSFPMVVLLSIYLNNYLHTLGVIKFSEEISHGMALSFPIFVTFLIYKFIIFK